MRTTLSLLPVHLPHLVPPLVPRRSLLLAACCGALLPAAADARDRPLNVLADESLDAALVQADALWRARGFAGSHFSFGASRALARQIDQGRGGQGQTSQAMQADLFVCAGETWMGWLAERGRLIPGTRRLLLGNRLVLAERKAGLKRLSLASGADLAGALGPGGKLALVEAGAMPTGTDARQALVSLGLWNGVKHRLLLAPTAREALLRVERGTAAAAIALGSDVSAAPGLAAAGAFPRDSHTPILYPGAALEGSDMPQRAAALLAFLAGAEAQAVFHNLGFSRA